MLRQQVRLGVFSHLLTFNGSALHALSTFVLLGLALAPRTASRSVGLEIRIAQDILIGIGKLEVVALK